MRRLLTLPSLTDDAARAGARASTPANATTSRPCARHGWHLLDPAAVARHAAAYRTFVRGSWAELGIAKLGYVASRCGWFSDRSVCYLAVGPAGGGAGHGLRRLAAGRQGPAVVSRPPTRPQRRSTRCAATTRATAAPHAGWQRTCSTPIACWGGCWSACDR